MRGWKYAEENPAEAAQIVVDADQTGLQTLEHQTYMMGEVAKLTAGSNGALDPADFQATVDALLAAVSPENPAITKAPDAGAWTHAITDLALQ
jgi:NitT/TauT family transport system substrate-binding protein